MSLDLSRCGAGVGRLRRALLLLAALACSAAAVLYWRQQSDDQGNRPVSAAYSNGEPQWSWVCREDRCERRAAAEAGVLQSLQTCNMLCASTQLWPQPTGAVSLATAAVRVRAADFTFHVAHSPAPAVTALLHEAFALLQRDLRRLEAGAGAGAARGGGGEAPRPVLVRVAVNGSADPRLRLDTDESYSLRLRADGARLLADVAAQSFCGARHGLETLSQLVWLDPLAGGLLALRAAAVQDAPRFPYRGLMLDTARNFFPLEDLMRTVDAMAASKLNTFHWHVSDSQSFPLRLQSVPELARHGAYGPGATYSTSDVRALVRHARARGVRVLLEVDAPAHVGRAWGWGEAAGLGALAHCVEAQPWAAYCGEPPCGQLNPRNPHVYALLERVYAELLALTDTTDVFHLGGDEVSLACWQRHHNESDPMELWMEFTRGALAALARAAGGRAPPLVLLWSSPLTRSPYLERLDAAALGVQVWGGSAWPESAAALDAGWRAVLSHVDAWYLDCGFGSWRDSGDGACNTYRTWQHVYEHRPWAGQGAWRVAGGAACQWSEQLGAGGLDARVWPRAAALGERLWADPDTGPAGAAPDVYLRLDTHAARLAARGVRPAALWPRWCTENPYACH
ncbi:hypothetical protein JYU34_014618 [Plutella xylostella]|uniref:beta-N-acetylhexosaminidase n=1 Tax=Plutella xylostella TaxID=51655 RepID=A0ABQ7Q921_PLUXY|nr:hypothetical protein JYU34_014618 [Plutella xylostella]